MDCSIARVHGGMVSPVMFSFHMDDASGMIACHAYGGPGNAVDFRMRYGWDGRPIPVNHGLDPVQGCYSGVLAPSGWVRGEDECNLVETYTASFWENEVDARGRVTMDTWRDYPNNSMVQVGAMLNDVAPRLLLTWGSTRNHGSKYGEWALRCIGSMLGLINQVIHRFGPAGIDLMRIIADGHGTPGYDDSVKALMTMLTGRMDNMGTVLTILLRLDSMYAIHDSGMITANADHDDSHGPNGRSVGGAGLVPMIPILSARDLALLRNDSTLRIRVSTMITGETDNQSVRLMRNHSTVTMDTMRIIGSMMTDDEYRMTMLRMIEMMSYVLNDTVEWNEYPTLIKPYIGNDEQHLLNDAAMQATMLNNILSRIVNEWEQAPTDNPELLKNTAVTLITVLIRYMDSPNYINDETLRAGAQPDDFISQSYEETINDAIINIKHNFPYMPIPDHEQLTEWYTLPTNVMHEEYEQYKSSIGYE